MVSYDPELHRTFERYARFRQEQAYKENYHPVMQEPMKDVTPEIKLLEQQEKENDN